MTAELKQYIVQVPSNPIPDDVRAQGKRAMRAWQQTQTRDALTALNPVLETEILAKFGGQIIVDGKDYGVQGKPGQYASFILIKTTAEGAEAIQKLAGVSGVFFNGTATAISTTPDAPAP